MRGARQQPYATASVLAIEAAIAEVVARGTATGGVPMVAVLLVERALLGAAIRVGRPLTVGQESAVRGICGDGRRVSLVLGVAGSGKTTAALRGRGVHGRQVRGDRHRHLWRKEAATWAAREASAQAKYDDITGPELDRLEETANPLERQRRDLHAALQERRAWLEEHPEATARLHTLDRDLNPVIDGPEIQQALG